MNDNHTQYNVDPLHFNYLKDNKQEQESSTTSKNLINLKKSGFNIYQKSNKHINNFDIYHNNKRNNNKNNEPNTLYYSNNYSINLNNTVILNKSKNMIKRGLFSNKNSPTKSSTKVKTKELKIIYKKLKLKNTNNYITSVNFYLEKREKTENSNIYCLKKDIMISDIIKKRNNAAFKDRMESNRKLNNNNIDNNDCEVQYRFPRISNSHLKKQLQNNTSYNFYKNKAFNPNSQNCKASSNYNNNDTSKKFSHIQKFKQCLLNLNNSNLKNIKENNYNKRLATLAQNKISTIDSDNILINKSNMNFDISKSNIIANNTSLSNKFNLDTTKINDNKHNNKLTEKTNNKIKSLNYNLNNKNKRNNQGLRGDYSTARNIFKAFKDYNVLENNKHINLENIDNKEIKKQEVVDKLTKSNNSYNSLSDYQQSIKAISNLNLLNERDTIKEAKYNNVDSCKNNSKLKLRMTCKPPRLNVSNVNINSSNLNNINNEECYQISSNVSYKKNVISDKSNNLILNSNLSQEETRINIYDKLKPKINLSKSNWNKSSNFSNSNIAVNLKSTSILSKNVDKIKLLNSDDKVIIHIKEILYNKSKCV